MCGRELSHAEYPLTFFCLYSSQTYENHIYIGTARVSNEQKD
jgi:hypothetical protein